MVAEVRNAEPGDLPSVLTLLSEMHGHRRSYEPTPVEQQVFSRMLADPARALLVALEDAEVVGTVDLIVVENLSRDARRWAAIENLIVHEPFRGHGHATRLLLRAIEIARGMGCYKVQLVSHRSRGKAQKLYKKLGFDAPVMGFRKYLQAVD